MNNSLFIYMSKIRIAKIIFDKNVGNNMKVPVAEDYYFKVNVREGAPGWADDDSYTSRPFKTFADAYEALVIFNPHRLWRHLRRVQEMHIWRKGHPMVTVFEDGCAIKIEDLHKLDVTEDEFDEIIVRIDAKL